MPLLEHTQPLIQDHWGKNKDPKFLDIVSKFDIFCISELHTHKDIPGYTLKKQKFRPKTHKGPKIGGGIALYIRQNIANNFKLIPNTNVDSIWIKDTSDDNRLHLGFYYCSPEDANSNFLETVNSEIEMHSNYFNTYIFGDFNARTKIQCENITSDKFDKEMGIQNNINTPLPSRNSEDLKIVNKRGKDFLDICRINDLCIANGRTLGDLFGKYTCHQKKGSSVVDYHVFSYTAFQNIIRLPAHSV